MSNVVAVPTPPPALSRRRQVGPSSARSLLLTVLGELVLPSSGSAWTRALVATLGAAGVEEAAARKALARTAAEGWIGAQRSGRHVRWTLTPAGRALLSDGARRIYSFGRRGERWDGGWTVVVVSVPEEQREARHVLRTRLSWAGFGSPAPGVWVSPHADADQAAAEVLNGLRGVVPVLSFRGAFGTAGDPRSTVAQAWDLDALAAQYADFVAGFSRLRPRDDDATLAAQVRLVHAWRRFPFLDPELPREMLPAQWVGRRAGELFARLHAAWEPGARRAWEALERGDG